jgi:type II secretory pathway pseudopilin PulG
MTTNTTIRRRAAFTLVELMVAAAVCVLIMAILSQAFVIGTTTMRELKATGDMQDQLRAAGIVIRSDLELNHFAPDDSKPNKGLKLSDQRLDLLFPDPTAVPALSRVTGWRPPVGGFFRARSSPSFIEGYDNDNLASYRIGGDARTGHYLHFTVVRPGGRDQDVFSAPSAGGGTLTSPAAEIAIFLDPTPAGSTGGVPYFNLIRRQRLVAMDDTDAQRFRTATDRSVYSAFTDTSSGTPTPRINTLATITNPLNRLGGTAGLNSPLSSSSGDDNLSASPSRPGDDILLSFVTSFEVKLMWTPAQNPPPLSPLGTRGPRGFTSNPTNPFGTLTQFGTDNEALTGPGSETTDAPYDTLPARSSNSSFANQFVFDTWTTALTGWDANGRSQVGQASNTNAIPLRMRVRAVKIVVRVWDQKLKLSRQMTLFQDL